MRIGKILQILGVSAALAVYSVWLESRRDLSDDFVPKESIALPRVPLLRLSEAEALWKRTSTVFLDVRSAIDYQFGHIRGAINIPEEEFERSYPAYRSRLEKAKHIVVYCKSRDCGKSLWAAIRLRERGLMQTAIYPSGWNEWDLQGKPVTKSQ